MIQRIVCFKFKSNATQDQIAAHMRDFSAMKEGIPQIQEYRGGLTLPADSQVQSPYDSMHYLTFSSLEDVDVYFSHPVHKQFIQRNRSIWEIVLVLNGRIEA